MERLSMAGEDESLIEMGGKETETAAGAWAPCYVETPAHFVEKNNVFFVVYKKSDGPEASAWRLGVFSKFSWQRHESNVFFLQLLAKNDPGKDSLDCWWLFLIGLACFLLIIDTTTHLELFLFLSCPGLDRDPFRKVSCLKIDVFPCFIASISLMSFLALMSEFLTVLGFITCSNLSGIGYDRLLATVQ